MPHPWEDPTKRALSSKAREPADKYPLVPAIGYAKIIVRSGVEYPLSTFLALE